MRVSIGPGRTQWARMPYTPPDILLTRGQKGGGRRGEDAAAHGSQGLADQRTAECGALGGSREECPSRQENGVEVQEKVAPRRAGIRRTCRSRSSAASR